MRAIARLILTTTFCLTTAVLAASDVPTITVSKGDRISVNAEGLSGGEGAAATPIVQKALARAGQPNPRGPAPSTGVHGPAPGQLGPDERGPVLARLFR